MLQRGVDADVVTCCALISALERGGQWLMAERVFVRMCQNGVSHSRFAGSEVGDLHLALSTKVSDVQYCVPACQGACCLLHERLWNLLGLSL